MASPTESDEPCAPAEAACNASSARPAQAQIRQGGEVMCGAGEMVCRGGAMRWVEWRDEVRTAYAAWPRVQCMATSAMHARAAMRMHACASRRGRARGGAAVRAARSAYAARHGSQGGGSRAQRGLPWRDTRAAIESERRRPTATSDVAR
jgi:hypothetical protein